jgi:predicted RNA-binding Zn ribbon-like protein
MSKTKAGEQPELRDEFIFVGNELALDFLNTRPVLADGPKELLTDFKALVRWFQAAGTLSAKSSSDLLRSPAAEREAILKTMHKFRERFRKELNGWERSGQLSHSMVEELNRLLAAHPMHDHLSRHGSELLLEEWFEPRIPDDLIAPIALSAARLFAAADHTRVRQCAQCVLHFHDVSKKGTRRWCSMQLCGNRAKVAAYAARQRS